MAFTSSLSAFGLKPATTSTPQQQQQQQPSTATTSFANAPPLGQNQSQQQQNIFGTFGQNTQPNQQQPNQQTTLPAGSLFGQPQQNQQTLPAGSLFGQPQTQNQTLPTGSSLFGQQQQQPQQQPSGSLFGQQQQQPQQQPSGSLFGQQQQQPQQQPSGSLFSQQQQQPQQQPSGSLFGQQQQQPQQQPSGSLFGQQQQQPQQQPSGSLFGQQQQQPQQPSGSLFGQQQQQPQQQNQTLPPGSLFGQPQQQNQTLPAGSLFGQPQQQNQQNLPPGSLFGQPQQPQQQQAASIFGGGAFGTNTQQQQKPQQQSLFSNLNTNTTNPLQAQPTLPSGAFGSNTGTSAFGSVGANPLFNKSQQPQQQPQQQQSNTIFGNSTQNTGFPSLGQPAGLSNSAQGPPLFTKSTKFNDLPDNIKKTLEQIDSYIQGRVQISKDLHQRKLGDEATKGHESIRALHKEFINTATIIRNDLHLTQDVKAKVDQAVEDTIVATRIIDGFRNPQSGNTYLKDHASFPLEYFTRVADQMKERLAWYRATIEQIERKLSSSATAAQTPQGIAATLQVQHKTFLSLASHTAAVDGELQKIKALYTQLWRAKTGSVRDPFNDNVKRSETPADFGLGSLNVR